MWARAASNRAMRRLGFAAWTASAVGVGVWAAEHRRKEQLRTLPPGYRSCCEAHDDRSGSGEVRPREVGTGVGLSPAAASSLREQLQQLVGAANVQLSAVQKGARLGQGEAFAVVSPGSIQQAVELLQLCVDAGVNVLPQGANTGLTGGSVPREGRPTVVINMKRMNTIQPLEDGNKLCCMAGAGIYDASQVAKGIQKESHSILGSVFLNPTVAAGVAFGSGGTQIRKGPAYTVGYQTRINDAPNTLGTEFHPVGMCRNGFCMHR